ncbi:YcdB/YcdC domain-containing protein [Viridibacillus sp. NPDC096237]|uniref:YcdB/YcdC domain-containing protein n=1 Tax=Viridibacillus sp. NPDC096237 TaxID=3390721 RepID=UPI003CFBDB92
MIKEQLKQKAQAIGGIPSGYELEIEDYRENELDSDTIFVWKDPHDEENGIWVTLDRDSQLIGLTKYTSSKSTIEHLANERLQELALQFVFDHYPNAFEQFTLEKIKERQGGRLQFTYSQYELELFLPLTGFFVEITKSGEIVCFRYDGVAEKIIHPDKIIHKDEARSILLNELIMETTIDVLSKEVYEEGDDLSHLMYEPCLRSHQLLADGKTPEIEREEEISRQLIPLPKPTKTTTKDVDAFIGLDRSIFQQIREQEMGDTIGTVWRIAKDEPELSDRSFEGFFKQRNDKTIKIITYKDSGRLKGVYSFLDRKGSLQLSMNECEEIAMQFLYKLYPQADQFFRMKADTEEDETNACFHLELYHCGIHLRFGFTCITVNRTTGHIDNYLGPDIHPELIAGLPSEPAISKEQAKELFTSLFDVELQWRKEYTDDSEGYYQLVYIPMYPNLEGDLAFIEAEDARVIVKKDLF